MDYTEAILQCLKKLPPERLKVLKEEWERKYAEKEIGQYFKWVFEKLNEVHDNL